MIKIKKVLNSSVVLVSNEKQKEYILLGKGIGYGKKSGSKVEESEADQIFIPIDNLRTKEIIDFFGNIPSVYINITQKVVKFAEEKLKTKLNTGIYITLMDHLNFAVERYNKKMIIKNRVYWEIKNYYPSEFEIGIFTLELLDKEFNIKMPFEEAANIAFHIINAQGEYQENRDGMMYAEMISGITNIVKYNLNSDIDSKNIHYIRFITHVKFFVERFFANKMLKDKDKTLFKQISESYPKSMEISFKIKEYIEKKYDKEMSKDELTYLAIHIHRLIMANK
ncbi:BglG family transcriptional antiterminator [Oceanotoga teriensis]|uniref:BglG family transcriptional antiterminator n=1 Tax=Oceanotoga teriensis TaxID=515440 RepID=A0AA45C5K1_9BACT|nr:PRD domain-containing protein [Oceanotoga teriensis]PWJ88999.1 BglG family transcriptional antiterminator [Oceanotoga teriensis]